MIQIQKEAPLIKKILREQLFKEGISYKMASFVFHCQVHEGVLLYNLLTKELIKIEDVENDKHKLIEKWYLLPSDMDEYAFVSRIKQVYFAIRKKNNVKSCYTIFTTTHCNARCYYCFEKGQKKIQMDNLTAIKVAKFIKRDYQDKLITLQWFGGEPLYNSDAIDIITSDLNKNSIKFKSEITTNAYLFTPMLIEKAKTVWHLKKAQITLDGTEIIYNKSKAYIHADGNPFKKVIYNILELVKSEIEVIVRLNLTATNYEDLVQLVQQFSNQFKGNKFMKIYATPLFEYIKCRDELRKDIFCKLAELQRMINKNRLGVLYEYFGKVRLNHCKADNEANSLVVFPDGNIGLCEHNWGKQYFGNIEDSHLDYAQIKEWQSYSDYGTKCRNCKLYADCLKLNNCETNDVCNKEIIDYDEMRIIETMLQKYIEFCK